MIKKRFAFVGTVVCPVKLNDTISHTNCRLWKLMKSDATFLTPKHEKPFRFVKSPQRPKSSSRSPERHPRFSTRANTKTCSTTTTGSIVEMDNNANNPNQSDYATGTSPTPRECVVATSWNKTPQGQEGAPVATLSRANETEVTPKTRTKCLQTASTTTPLRANVSIQAGDHKLALSHDTQSVGSQDDLFSGTKGIVVEGIIVRTEDGDEVGDNNDTTRSIHLIPFAVPAPVLKPPAVFPEMLNCFCWFFVFGSIL